MTTFWDNIPKMSAIPYKRALVGEIINRINDGRDDKVLDMLQDALLMLTEEEITVLADQYGFIDMPEIRE